jgi:NADPH-dependent 2,4-dienoyl-CoA reductase/sulfur reductase-like enzyme/nitrite reductase/ring-hydroxylating ferredoxin subunit
VGEQTVLSGPDLRADGYPADSLGDGEMVLGHADDKPVVLARSDGEVYAVSARCTHYGASLGAGTFDGDLLFCPLHHSGFNVRTGRAERAPALNPIPRYEVVAKDGLLYVGGEMPAEWGIEPLVDPPESVVVVGAGAAGGAAVETLRAEGYEGPITLIGAEETVPTDRPNLSKDYLAGTAPEDWMPLRGTGFYEEQGITLILGTAVTAIDRGRRTVTLDDGSEVGYGALLLAPGSDPIRIPVPGADLPHVHTLRTLADSRSIIEGAETASSAVVLGASFIGLEVAASLRNRDIDVHVVAPEDVPMDRVLGVDVGRFVQALHESHGVEFHLGHVADAIEPGRVVLNDGTAIAADLVVMGVGVRPNTELAGSAGLGLDNGIVVDEQLRTSDPHIWAAGDAVDYPDLRLGRAIRVEHWVVAQRHGQVAAQNILGRNVPFREAPFFWSQHYDVRINYVGHAERWDGYDIKGSIDDGDALIAYREAGSIAAVATIARDVESLHAQTAMESGDDRALEALL